ncbi:MAG TPA: protein kinase [Gemmataceae bacterium]|nr:protein kinase [Gemmataceae bacterium]
MSEVRACPTCGTELPADAPQGLCPQCLLAQGLKSSKGTEAAEAGQPPTTGFRRPFRPPTPAELAHHFPQLEVLDLLGQGGMGAVYKARQPGLDRIVALKILPPEAAEEPGFAERFGREARALARLSHPNIVAVYDFGQNDGLYYLLMEYVDGLNLRQLLQSGQLKPPQTLLIVPQVCEALQYAHDEGIVHRDIKPENILLDKKGRVKIADFGLAKLLGQAPLDLRLTGTRQVMGTPHYMAPEQMDRPLEVDHRADLYSLGVVLYEMLTGQLPLGRFVPPSQKVQVDVRLDEVVLRALEREPEQRYQRASEIKTDVESVQHAEPISEGPPALLLGRTPELEARVVEILRHDKIAAIRFFREATGAGLAAAKEAVEWIGRRRSERSGSFQSARNADKNSLSKDGLAAARQTLLAPALGLMLIGALNCTGLAVLLLSTIRLLSGGQFTVSNLGAQEAILLSMDGLLGLAILWGAWKMVRLKSLGLAQLGCVLALLPLSPCWFLGLPVGIWGLILLMRPEVRKHFPTSS